MERTASERGAERASSRNARRRAGRDAGRSNRRPGPVAALHRATGNQAVQASRETADRETTDRETSGTVDRSADGRSTDPTSGMCSRCARRYRAGKPLDCTDCEAALDRTPADRTGPGGVGGDVQPKLAVGSLDTPVEREAERVAEEVANASGPESTSPTAAGEACETCEGGESTAEIRRTASGAGGSALDGEQERRIRSATRGGRRLPADTREHFEERFGRDFSDVRVHTGPDADTAARSIGAEAFTVGTDVAFAEGNYRPGTTEGSRLLAHELTHVVQNGSSDRFEVRRLPSETPHGEPYEKGVKHDHRPSGEWSEVQERTDCNLWGENSVWNAISGSGVGPVGCVCLWYQPREVLETAIDQRMGDKPLAREHMRRYMDGSGDKREDVRSLVLDDRGVRTKLRDAIEANPRGDFKIGQGDYANQDFRFTFGAIDRFDYEVEPGAERVHVWFADRYEWHPVYDGLYTKKRGDEARATNCVHAAAVELKLEGAEDFWMYGHDTVALNRLSTTGTSGSSTGGSGDTGGGGTDSGGETGSGGGIPL